MGGDFRAAVARRYAYSIRMDGDSGPQAEVMKGHGEAEAAESCGSLSGVRVVLSLVVTTGSRGDAAVRVLPSQLSRAAAMASCKGAAMPARRHCQANHTQLRSRGPNSNGKGSRN